MHGPDKGRWRQTCTCAPRRPSAPSSRPVAHPCCQAGRVDSRCGRPGQRHPSGQARGLVESQKIKHGQLAGKLLVAGIARSTPAASGMETLASRSMEEPAALVMASVFWPRRLASCKAASVSEVSPDWRARERLDGARLAGRCCRGNYIRWHIRHPRQTAQVFEEDFGGQALWRLEPEAAIRISPSGIDQPASIRATSGFNPWAPGKGPRRGESPPAVHRFHATSHEQNSASSHLGGITRKKTNATAEMIRDLSESRGNAAPPGFRSLGTGSSGHWNQNALSASACGSGVDRGETV